MCTKISLYICVVLALVFIYFPERHAKYYDYISNRNILKELQYDYVQSDSNLQNCTYREIIRDNYDVDSVNNVQYITPLQGGEFKPYSCNSLINSAIIVPYRNRADHLEIFAKYMHGFLQKQNIRYRIFIVEQNDTLPFNRAKMLNYGAKVAISFNYTCLILHDIDLLPINTGNIYACSKQPRHMSSSIDVFRYNLPYRSLFGGAVSISQDHLKSANGMSNVFYGWGGEDDDFHTRLSAIGLNPYRFSPSISKYVMLVHKKEKPSPDRYIKMHTSLDRMKMDGLNSLDNNFVILNYELFTKVIVS